MNDRVHIVCLDAPAPPDYGGAIDMYYKIKALSAIGKKIHLHYFDYVPNRSAKVLLNCCEKIFSYSRKSGLRGLKIPLPYIVSTRINKQLISRLNEDDAPIILEGIHCTGIISFLKNKFRKIIVRVHNDEAVYYQRLAVAENNIGKKIYDKIESRLLHLYQKNLPAIAWYACLSQTDTYTFSKQYGLKKTVFIPCFVAWEKVIIQKGKGSYCLYHGNLSISENEEAVRWLIRAVFSKITIPLIIAGKGISSSLIDDNKSFAHIQFITNPSIDQVNDLVGKAQINVLPSVNNTGVKLKLLHALFRGRYCITNKSGVAGSGLEAAVVRAETGGEWIQNIQQLFTNEMPQNEILDREKLLQQYNNLENARKINALL